jgi:hypothetical protein
MDMQLRAGLAKEKSAFLGTKRFLALALVFLGIAIFYPLLVWGSGQLLMGIDDLGVEGMDAFGELGGIVTQHATTGAQSGTEGVTTVGLLVFLILINAFAGGEQKRKSIIIPQSAGLSNFNYILPKFIVFPLTAFAFTVISVFVASWFSVLLYSHNDLVLTNVLVSAVLAGVFNMLYVCLHLTLGTATGKAGMSSAICIVSAILVMPMFFAGINVLPELNPFIMNIAAISVAAGSWIRSEMLIGVIIAVIIMISVFYLALFVQNAKMIDNSGNDIII